MSRSEFDFIETCLAPLSRGFDGALDLGDDAALVEMGDGRTLVIAKDAMVEDVHFRAADPPDTVARKVLRTNLSDLAAMGAEPLAYLTAIARPGSRGDDWLEAIAAGFAADQSIWPIHLIGGDTVSTAGPAMLSCTILGTLPTGTALLRSGARPGDLVLVSGTLGDSALGLRVLQGLAADDEARLFLADRYRLPRPRTTLGTLLRGRASSAIDISDGLVADLGHILSRSQAGATIATQRLPLSRHAAGMPGALEAALFGGDDYELLFTLPPDRFDEVTALADIPVTVIGRIDAEPGLRVLDESGRPVDTPRRGWQHF